MHNDPIYIVQCCKNFNYLYLFYLYCEVLTVSRRLGGMVLTDTEKSVNVDFYLVKFSNFNF